MLAWDCILRPEMREVLLKPCWSEPKHRVLRRKDYFPDTEKLIVVFDLQERPQQTSSETTFQPLDAMHNSQSGTTSLKPAFIQSANHILNSITSKVIMNNTAQGSATGQEDYLDKGLDAAEKRFGGGALPTDKRNLTSR
jgi:hypothetical protein